MFNDKIIKSIDIQKEPISVFNIDFYFAWIGYQDKKNPSGINTSSLIPFTKIPELLKFNEEMIKRIKKEN